MVIQLEQSATLWAGLKMQTFLLH